MRIRLAVTSRVLRSSPVLFLNRSMPIPAKLAASLSPKSDRCKKLDVVSNYLGKVGDKSGVMITPLSFAKNTLASAESNVNIKIDLKQMRVFRRRTCVQIRENLPVILAMREVRRHWLMRGATSLTIRELGARTLERRNIGLK